MNVSFDIDEVLAHWVKHTFTIFGKPDDSPEEVTTWGNPKLRAWYPKTLKSEKFWLTIPVMNNIPNWLKPTVYISAREIPEKWTREWLWKNNFPYAPIVHTTKTLSKPDVMEDFNIDLHIDDAAHHYEEITALGQECLLFNRPWNTYVDTKKRIFTLEEIKKFIS